VDQPPYVLPEVCINCVHLAMSDSRVFRGGSFGDGALTSMPLVRFWGGTSEASPGRMYHTGFRCARSPL
jgi:formylglycine-generating enzyme required for sulfatase activity